jgi:integrase/recombinase XerC
MVDLARSWVIGLRAANRAERTQRLYLSGLRSLAGFLESRGLPTDPTETTDKHIVAYLADQLDHLSPATARARHGYLSVWFRWLVAEGEIETNPMTRIKAPTLDETLPDMVSDDDYAALLRACRGPGLTDRRDTAMIRLLEETGIRRAELAGLQVDAVDLTTMRIVVMGKGRRERVAPFTAETALALDRYLRERRRTHWKSSPSLWVGHVGPMSPNGVGEMLERRSRVAGIPKVNPHAFRHRFADRWKAAGGT